MAYTALYRKYRPTTFEDVIGQKTTVKILKNSIIENKIGHAYIFSGPRGTGKTSVAKIFAKAVNCLKKSGDVCKKCDVCKLLEDNDTDIIEIDAASNNGVDEIREIRNNAKLIPSIGKYKIYIIDEVHMLSTGAFNAMLKTLEEPPAHVIFILATTELQKIPLTILSRCQKFDFHKISEKEMTERLNYILTEEERTLDDSVIKLIVRLSDGCCRDAINLLDQALSLKNDNITEDDIYDITGEIKLLTIYELFDSIISSNYSKGLEIISENYNDGKNLSIIVNKMLIELRNISINMNVNEYFDEEEKKKYEKYKIIDFEQITQMTEILNNLSSELKRTTMQKIVFEIYFMQLCDIFKKNISKIEYEETIEVIESKIETDDQEKTLTEIKKEVLISENKEEKNYFPGNKKNIRINNALAEASKEILKENIKKYKNINEYTANKTFNNAVSILSEGNLIVSSEKYCIIEFKYESSINIFEKNIKEIEELLKKVLTSKYKAVAVTAEEWLKIKEEYIKNRENYKYMEEIQEEEKKIEKNEIESNVAYEIFGEDLITIK
ncbi:DNA polymerase III subunit gamma/tau [bacterium]|nr:DNA polymerase III subunit gamma/tau [bacterium]